MSLKADMGFLFYNGPSCGMPKCHSRVKLIPCDKSKLRAAEGQSMQYAKGLKLPDLSGEMTAPLKGTLSTSYGRVFLFSLLGPLVLVALLRFINWTLPVGDAVAVKQQLLNYWGMLQMGATLPSGAATAVGGVLKTWGKISTQRDLATAAASTFIPSPNDEDETPAVADNSVQDDFVPAAGVASAVTDLDLEPVVADDYQGYVQGVALQGAVPQGATA
jgi:hypothetical protein